MLQKLNRATELRFILVTSSICATAWLPLFSTLSPYNYEVGARLAMVSWLFSLP